MPASSRTPWHLWPVALVVFIGGLVGALDYLGVRFGFAPYTSRLPGTWLVWVEGLPAWVTALWAAAVWGGLLGGILLLMRERGAVLVLAASFLAMAVAVFGLVTAASPPLGVVAGQTGLSVVAGAVLFLMLAWLYARYQKTLGRLD